MEYQSLVTWKPTLDYLRCNPSFHGIPRYDGIIIDIGQGQVLFAILVLVFTCTIHSSMSQRAPLALVQPLAQFIGPRTRKDMHLCLYRLHAHDRISSQLIPMEAICRGVYLIQDPDNPLDYFAVDTTDTDIFVRLQMIFKPDSWTVVE